MQNNVLAYCKKEGLIAPGSTVFCAVSGGVDSVVLLDILLSLRERLGFSLQAAHFNHRLREDASDRDEAFVRALCQSRGVPLTVSSADVRARAEKTGESIEQAARALRYAFFETLRGTVATAHHADDNAETILLHLVRGTSLAGLCGIAPKRGQFIRPLLCATRAEIERYAKQRALAFVEDSTNAEDFCVRNRLRHHVMPLLREENPALSARLLTASRLLRDDEAYLQQQSQALLDAARRPRGFDCGVLQEAPRALRTRALRLLLQSIRAPKLSACHILAAEALVLSADPSASTDLPGGWILRREYGLAVLEKAAAPLTFAPTPLVLDRETFISALGLTVRCHFAKNFTKNLKSPSTFAFRCDTIDMESLVLRPRRSGDKIRLDGGTRTIKRLLIDRKVPAASRPLVPIIADKFGVLAVYPYGCDLTRRAAANENAIIITIEKEDMCRYDEPI